jgi:hypothetical protein
MDRSSFWCLHALIEDDPIFVRNGEHPGRRQRPPHIQLATFLCRVGAEGAVKTAAIMSIAEGTVSLYTLRVTRAFRNIRDEYLHWPHIHERDAMAPAMDSFGFPGCLGAGDGSLLRLRDKPLVNPYVYYSRKKFYAVCFLFSSL